MTIRVPIDPLDDDRVARIERAIVTALPARTHAPARWRAIAPWGFAIAAAAAAMIVWRMESRAPSATQTPAPIAVDAAAAGTRLDLGDAVITASEGAAFTVTRPDGGAGLAVDLAHGQVGLAVVHRAGRVVEVRAGDVDVVDVGTVFTVARAPHDDGDDDVDVAVSEGVVQVRHGGTIATIAAGQSWSRREKLAAIPPPPAPPDGTSGASGPAAPGGPSEHPNASHTRPSKHPKEPTADDPLGDLHAAIDAQPLARPTGSGSLADANGIYAFAYDEKAQKNYGEAGRHLELYMERFPYNEAALWLRIVVYCHGTLDDRCRQAAHTYRGFSGANPDRVQLAERIINSP